MELYTLHLHKALRYERCPQPTLEAFLGRADSSAEGSESLALWDIDALAFEGDEGPMLREPLPAPYWSGSALPAVEAAALSPAAGIKATAELRPDTEAFALEQGTYRFCQSRAANVEELRELLEWFIRESWWSGAPIRNKLFLRLVREDGKTAAQALSRDSKL